MGMIQPVSAILVPPLLHTCMDIGIRGAY